jgi:hypothetical protein
LVAYNGSPTRANIYLRNNEDPSVLKDETQNYLKQAEVLYPNINEPHSSKNPFDYDLDATEDNNGDTGIFGNTDELPEHIINFNPQSSEEPFSDKAIKYAIDHFEVPSAGAVDALAQSRINEAYNKPPTPIAESPIVTESSGDKWNRKVVGALGPGAESSTEAAKNYNLQEDLNKQGQGQQWKVTREGIIRDPLALEQERRIKLAQDQIERESPVNRVLQAGKRASQLPAKLGSIGKAKFLGPIATGASAANAVRAYERADELEQQGDTVGAEIARLNSYASMAGAIPTTPNIPLNIIKGVGTIGALGLSGAEALRDSMYKSVVKKRPKEVKMADGGSVPISLKHVSFHRKKRNG